jgi:SAM-dependent methyltransferase
MTYHHGMDAGQMWNDRYAGPDYAFGTDPNEFVVEIVEEWDPGRALDLGSGEGRNAVWLARRGWDVTAVDVSAIGIAKAQDLAAAHGVDVEFIVADLADFVMQPAGFDLVLLTYIQVPGPLRAVIHRTATAALRPGGVLVLVAHHLDNLISGVGGPRSSAVLFTEEQIRDDFAALEIERCERAIRVVAEGTRHGPGEAIDLVCVARKPE